MIDYIWRWAHFTPTPRNTSVFWETPYFEPKFQENRRESAKTVGNGIAQHKIFYHFSFDTIGKKTIF